MSRRFAILLIAVIGGTGCLAIAPAASFASASTYQVALADPGDL